MIMKIPIILLFLFAVSSAMNLSLNMTRNYTTEDFQDYTETFYSDWGSFILVIMAFAFSYILSDRYSNASLALGVGLVFLFFVTGSVIFVIGAMALIVFSMLLKQATG